MSALRLPLACIGLLPLLAAAQDSVDLPVGRPFVSSSGADSFSFPSGPTYWVDSTPGAARNNPSYPSYPTAYQPGAQWGGHESPASSRRDPVRYYDAEKVGQGYPPSTYQGQENYGGYGYAPSAYPPAGYRLPSAEGAGWVESPSRDGAYFYPGPASGGENIPTDARPAQIPPGGYAGQAANPQGVYPEPLPPGLEAGAGASRRYEYAPRGYAPPASNQSGGRHPCEEYLSRLGIQLPNPPSAGAVSPPPAATPWIEAAPASEFRPVTPEMNPPASISPPHAEGVYPAEPPAPLPPPSEAELSPPPAITVESETQPTSPPPEPVTEQPAGMPEETSPVVSGGTPPEEMSGEAPPAQSAGGEKKSEEIPPAAK